MGVSSFQPELPAPSSSIYKKGPNCGSFAMECRVYNEDPSKLFFTCFLIFSDFLPGDGVVIYRNQVEDNSHTIIENNVVTSPSVSGISYDPMLLKVITTGQSRLEVIDRMIQTLCRCNIYGVPTNIPFLVNLLQDKQFREKGADSKTVSEFKGISDTYDPFEISNAVAGYIFSQCVSTQSQVSGPWTQLLNYCNSHNLTRVDRLKVNSLLVDCQLSGDITKPNTYILRFNNRNVSIGLIRTSEDEMQISIDNEFVRSFVYPDRSGKVFVFPVTSTDRFQRKYTALLSCRCSLFR